MALKTCEQVIAENKKSYPGPSIYFYPHKKNNDKMITFNKGCDFIPGDKLEIKLEVDEEDKYILIRNKSIITNSPTVSKKSGESVCISYKPIFDALFMNETCQATSTKGRYYDIHTRNYRDCLIIYYKDIIAKDDNE